MSSLVRITFGLVTRSLRQESCTIKRMTYGKVNTNAVRICQRSSYSSSAKLMENIKADLSKNKDLQENLQNIDPGIKLVKPEIVGGIIPWKLMPLQGKIICFVTWPIMYYLSYLHEIFPWWASISITTLTLRALMTPLVINSIRTSTVYMNLMPKTTQLNKKMMEALQSSDTMEAQHYRMKLKALNKEHGVSDFQRLWPAFCQAPIFMSMYAILRTLSQNQESLKEGGILWFKDLSVMDPTFILPILTCSTLLLCIELGAETGGSSASFAKPIRWVMRALPVGIFYIIYDFPAAMLCYWVTSNFYSLVQSSVMRNKRVRKKLNIPDLIKHDRTALGLDKSFSQMLKDFNKNRKSQQGPEDLRRLDRIAFEKAAIGPIQKTYKDSPARRKPQKTFDKEAR